MALVLMWSGHYCGPLQCPVYRTQCGRTGQMDNPTDQAACPEFGWPLTLQTRALGAITDKPVYTK